LWILLEFNPDSDQVIKSGSTTKLEGDNFTKAMLFNLHAIDVKLPTEQKF
jgi:hypothetical protein